MPGLNQQVIPDEARKAILSELEAKEQQLLASLKELRTEQRAAQQALQQEASSLSAKLASFDSDLQAKRAEAERLRSAFPVRLICILKSSTRQMYCRLVWGLRLLV